MGNASTVRRKRVSNNAKIEFLSCWPGSVLEWSNDDLLEFAKCFTAHKVPAGKEISTKDPKSFFIVAKGSVEVQAILPTIRKKTGNIREFLCKKDTGDMVYMPSMRKLIAESNAKDIYERENIEHKEHISHKRNVADIVDTVSIKSISESIILQLDWAKFECNFDVGAVEKRRMQSIDCKIDIGMLRTVMETNLTDYLEKLPVLAEIPHTKLETLVRMCHYKVEKKGSIICREGDVGEEVYIVLSGEVKVEALASQRMVELLESPSDLVSMSMRSVMSNSIRNMESTNNITPVFPVKRRSVSFKDPDDDKNGSGNNKTTDDIPPQRKNGQSTYAHRRRTLFMAGQISRREMLKNLKNRQEKNDNDKKTKMVELAQLGPGDYFGEMATFIELPRAATVTATTNVLMASLSKTNFRILYNAISPDLQGNVEDLVKKHMIQNIFQLKCPFLDQISIAKSDAMAELTTISRLDKDVVVFNQNEDADSFYFVYSGTLKVEKKNSKGTIRELGHLNSGDYFGELAVINNSKRLATITTVTRTVLLELTRDNFHKCFHDKPELVSEFILRMKGRTVDLKTMMDHKVSRNAFTEFLDVEHGKENILFYDAVEDYKKYFVGDEGGNKDANKTTTTTTDDNNDNTTTTTATTTPSTPSSSEDMIKKATYIIQNYLSSRGADAVNVPSAMYEKSQKLLELKDFKVDSFDDAQVEIFKLMERDLFQRFRKSQLYTSLMEKVRSYDDLEVQLLA